MAFNKKAVYRVQFRFWLDVIRPEEDQLAEYVNDLKEKRSFAQTIREALHLIRDLRQGRVEVLLKLFPWIEEHFSKPISAPVSVALPDPFREQLDRIERYFNQLPAQPRPFLLAEPPLPDDEPTIQMERITNGKGQWNALISMAMLNGNFEDLAPEILHYGVEIGRIPREAVAKKLNSGAPKKMDVPQFADPVFEDDDHEIDLLVRT